MGLPTTSLQLLRQPKLLINTHPHPHAHPYIRATQAHTSAGRVRTPQSTVQQTWAVLDRQGPHCVQYTRAVLVCSTRGLYRCAVHKGCQRPQGQVLLLQGGVNQGYKDTNINILVPPASTSAVSEPSRLSGILAHRHKCIIPNTHNNSRGALSCSLSEAQAPIIAPAAVGTAAGTAATPGQSARADAAMLQQAPVTG